MEQKGFSLVELNICCVLIAILLAVAYPVMGGMRQAAYLRMETRELYGNFHRAKIEALKRNTFVVFTLTAEGYEFFVDDGAGGGAIGDWERQEGEQILINHKYTNDVKMKSTTFQKSRGRFSFKKGIVGGRVILENKLGSQTEVVLNVIGRVRVAN